MDSSSSQRADCGDAKRLDQEIAVFEGITLRELLLKG